MKFLGNVPGKLPSKVKTKLIIFAEVNKEKIVTIAVISNIININMC